MKTSFTLLLAYCVVFTASLAAAAPVLSTPVLTASTSGEGRDLECYVVNVSEGPVTVTVELVNADDGSIADSEGPCTLAPGRRGCTASGSCSNPLFVCDAFCRFTGASKKSIRGSIILTPQATGDALVALPAQ